MVWVIGIPPFLRTLAFATSKSILYFYFHKNLEITSVKIESTTKHLQNAPMLTLGRFFYNKKIVVFLLSCQLENPPGSLLHLCQQVAKVKKLLYFRFLLASQRLLSSSGERL